jgi:glycosyltransferase involved in cell wall biosynthesis
MKYPRILVTVLGRINKADTANNGLLLRNIFGNWPRENLAQIFSGGDNGDQGFFGRYHCLGPGDRRLGSLFFKLKPEAQRELSHTDNSVASTSRNKSFGKIFRSLGKHFLIDAGLYELIFRPQISREMQAWVEEFKPDIIFAQGYNLTFTWLPMMLAHRFQIPIVYYPGDDWPANRYRPDFCGSPIVSRLARYAVVTSSRKLVQMSAVRLANCQYMREEYLKRYGQEFTVLMHGYDFKRTEAIPPLRLAEPSRCWIVCTGDFDQHRLPLLADLNQACEILHGKGYNVHATVFPVNPMSEIYINSLPYVDFQTCPLHDGLMAVLRGADILFLPERFDETSKFIKVSISTKAHLFMFTGKPIVVYSDPETGIARYAKEEGWAAVIDRRDPFLLAQSLERLITDGDERRHLIACARQTALKNHHLPTIQTKFYNFLCSTW